MHNKLDHYKELWSLTGDGQPFSTHSSLLQPVIYRGTKCMLKIAISDEERQGNSLMLWYNGNAAAPVLQHDKGAFLMERATGGNSLAEMVKNGHDDEAGRIICSVVAKLHTQKGPYPDYLIPLTEWFKSLEPAASKYGGVLVECSKITNDLLNNPTDQVVLHGDIHHGNILDFGAKGWLAIDPKGLIGESYFDYTNLFCNPDKATATMPGRLARQVKIICAEAGLDPIRLLQWIAAWAGLSASWAMEDGTNAEPALAVAKIALSVL